MRDKFHVILDVFKEISARYVNYFTRKPAEIVNAKDHLIQVTYN